MACDFDQAGIAWAVRRVAQTKSEWAMAPSWLFPGAPYATMMSGWKALKASTKLKMIQTLMSASNAEINIPLDSHRALRAMQLGFAIELEERAKHLFAETYTPTSLFDSYACATWTSCVAMRVHLEQQQGHSLDAEVDLCLVPCQHNERMAYAQFENTYFSFDESQFAHPLNLLYQRASQHAMRGWKSSLKELMLKNRGVAQIVLDSMMISLTGLHPCLPANVRPCWQARLLMQLSAPHELSMNQYATIMDAHALCKDSIRRTIAATMYGGLVPGMIARRLNNVSRNFDMPPLSMPHTSLVRQMVTLSRVGARMYEDFIPLKQAFVVIQMQSDVQMHSKMSDERNSRNLKPAFDPLGEHHTCVAFCRRVLSSCFQSNFVPFLLWTSIHDARPLRLDSTQYTCFHWQMNSAQRLIGAMEAKDVEFARRVAFRYCDSGIINITTACTRLGFTSLQVIAPFVGGRNNTQRQIEYDHLIINTLTPRELGILLCFGLFSYLSESILVANLSSDLKRCQIEALRKRHKITSDEELIDRCAHLHTLVYCLACNRVANCIAPEHVDQRSSTPFHRIGVFRTGIQPGVHPATFYCSNRNSATYKSAKLYEKTSECLRVEERMQDDDADNPQYLEALHNMAHDGTLASRMRRDSKRVMMQTKHVEACGSNPMTRLQLLGRIVRVNYKWYTICCVCGNMMCVNAHSRFNGVLCCLHCDPKLARDFLHTHENTAIIDNTSSSSSSSPGQQQLSSDNHCRMCGRSCPKALRLHSPHDTFGSNSQLPPQSRYTTWCSTHQKPWLKDALTSLSSSLILAHLTLNTQPMSA